MMIDVTGATRTTADASFADAATRSDLVRATIALTARHMTTREGPTAPAERRVETSAGGAGPGGGGASPWRGGGRRGRQGRLREDVVAQVDATRDPTPMGPRTSLASTLEELELGRECGRTPERDDGIVHLAAYDEFVDDGPQP